MDIGYRLQIARKMKGMTMKQLSELSGVSDTAITNYEKALTVPRIDLLSELARTLGVSINWLIFGNHPPKADRELMAKLVLYEKKMEA